MPQITLDTGDAVELAEMLTFLADWLSSSHKPILEQSLVAFVGHPAYDTDAVQMFQFWRCHANAEAP